MLGYKSYRGLFSEFLHLFCRRPDDRLPITAIAGIGTTEIVSKGVSSPSLVSPSPSTVVKGCCCYHLYADEVVSETLGVCRLEIQVHTCNGLLVLCHVGSITFDGVHLCKEGPQMFQTCSRRVLVNIIEKETRYSFLDNSALGRLFPMLGPPPFHPFWPRCTLPPPIQSASIPRRSHDVPDSRPALAG